MRQVILFILICAVAGITAALGSVAGAVLSHTSLFVGAVLGGLIGVYTAARLGKLLRLIADTEVNPTTIGGCAGFLIAGAIAVTNLHTPVIPILSAGLVGVGSLVALVIHRRANRVEKTGGE